MRKLLVSLSLLLLVCFGASTALAKTAAGNLVASSTDCAVDNSCVSMTLPADTATVAVTILDTPVFVGTVQFEAAVGNSDYVAVEGAPAPSGIVASSATAAGSWRFNVAGYSRFRVRCSSYTSGTIPVFQVSTLADTSSVDVADRIGRLVGRMSNYDVLSNGTLGVLNSTVTMDTSGLSTIGLGVSGTWVGTIVAETTAGDGVWDTIPLVDNTMGSAALSTTSNGNFLLGVAGALTTRVRMSLYTSGTATVYLEGSSALSGMFLTRSVPTGVNTIGSVVTLTSIDSAAPVFYRLNSAATANLTSVTDGATQLYGITVSSTDATVVYLKLYNKATAPDPSNCSANTDCPVFDVAVPSYAVGGVVSVALPSGGVYLSTGLGLAIVTGAADTDETAVAANEVKVNLIYKH